MRIVQTSTIVNIEGFTDRLERGFAVRRENVNYEHVKEPVIIPRPQIERGMREPPCFLVCIRRRLG